MKKLVFNHLYLPEWVENWECRHCGRSGQRVRLHFPDVERIKDNVRLVYSAECQCGKRTPFKVEMPILLLGLAFVRQFLGEARSHRHKGFIDVTPMKANVTECLLRDFTRLITDFAGQALGFPPDDSASPDDTAARWEGLTDMERIKFGMSVREWQEFRRRLGLDEDTAGGDGMSAPAS